MRKLGISNSAVEQLKRLSAAVQQIALDAIAPSKAAGIGGANAIDEKTPDLLTYESDDLVFVLRQLRDRLIVLSVFFFHDKVAAGSE